MTLAAGDKLGPYEIVEPIGAGGMGAVYKARDPRLGRMVAIKVLPADKVGKAERQQRFLQEARAASALNHPHIVSIFDIGAEGAITYLVMELIEGKPLDKLIPEHGMRVSEVLRLAGQMADACAKAHSNGIVHRDLKPANIMVTNDGAVKILDFGLAKLLDAPATSADDETVTAASPRTEEGVVVGTPAYMSPEQAEGKPVDARSDVFSFGALLYEMATGRRAFQGSSKASVMAAVLKEEPKPPAEIRQDLPAEVDRLILRCLRKEPARRAQSMADLRVMLDELKDLESSGRLSTPSGVMAAAAAPARSTNWLAWSLATFGLVAAAAALTWRSGSGGGGPAAEPVLEPVVLTDFPGMEGDPSFSPEGSQVAFTWNGQEANIDVYVKVVGAGAPLRLTSDPRMDYGPVWSPDGKSIAFLRQLANTRVGLQLVPPLGGAERSLGEFYTTRVPRRQLASVSWTPDSRFLVLAARTEEQGTNQLLLVNAATGQVSTLLAAEPTLDFHAPAIAPDGKTMVYLAKSQARLVTLSPGWKVEGPSRSVKTERGIDVLAWAPSGDSLVVNYTSLAGMPLFRVRLPGGESSPLGWTGQGASSPAVAPRAGRLAFVRALRDSNLWMIPIEAGRGAKPVMVAGSSAREVAPRYSPDGKKLAFHSHRSGPMQIWATDAEGMNPAQLTNMKPDAMTGTPRWSPDSRRIAFDSSESGYLQIYVIDAQGGTPRAVTSGPANSFGAVWSPDGQWIYFTSNREGAVARIWRVSPAGGAAERVTEGQAEGPDFSPDGAWLYYVKDSGAAGLWRRPAAGGPEAKLAESVYRNNFAVTAKAVYYCPAPKLGRLTSIRALDPATGVSREIHTIEKPIDLGLAVTPDGQHLVYSQVDASTVDLMMAEGFR